MSESIGTVFVEVSLDKTKFEYQQQKLIDDTKKVANAVEGSLQKSFQNLSVKTDNLYQLMANKAIVSYERIKQASNTSAAEEYRVRASMVAKINALNMEKTASQSFSALGIRSESAIIAEMQNVMRSYKTATAEAGKNAADLERIEVAKNERLKALHNELNAEYIAGKKAAATESLAIQKALGASMAADVERQLASQKAATEAYVNRIKALQKEASARVSTSTAVHQQTTSDWQMLGAGRSTEAIKAEQSAIEAAYLRQKALAQGNANDLIAIEQGKTAKMLALNKELHAVQLQQIESEKKVQLEAATASNAARELENKANADYWISRKKYETEYAAFWEKALVDRQTKTIQVQKAEIEAYAMAHEKKIALLRSEAAQRAEIAKTSAASSVADWQMMGGGNRSSAAIKAEQSAVEAAYLRQKELAAGNARDIVVLEQAKTAKMLALNKEYHAVALAEKRRAAAAEGLITEATIARANQANAEYWMGKIAFEKKVAAESMAAQQKLGMSMAADVERKIANEKAVASASQAQWDSLGIRATSAIKAEMDIVRKSASEKQALYARGSQDYINIERAKNDKLKSLNKEMVGSHDMSMAAMTRLVLRFYAAWYVALTAITAILAPVREGFRYLAAMETSQLAIAASLATAGRFIDQTTQKALEGQAALNEAQKMSKSIVKELEFENIRTIATLDELVKAYQTALPVAMAKGFDVEQVKSFTVAMVQAAGAIGLPFDQMAEEIRSLLTGSINPKNSRIATVLGLRNEDINQFKGNADELFNFLMDKLSAYKEAGIEAQTTWAGLWSNAKDIADQFLGKITEPLFNEIKTGMQNLINNMVTLDEKTKTIKWNPAFVGEIEHIKSGVNDIIDNVKGLWNFYQSLPDGVTGAAGYGILGRMLFGSWKAAALIGTVQFLSTQLNNLGALITGFKPKGIGESFSDLSKYIQGIDDAFNGKRDLNTGRVFSQLEIDVKAAREEYQRLLLIASEKGTGWVAVEKAEKTLDGLLSQLGDMGDFVPKTTLSDLLGVSLLESEPGSVEYVANVVSGVEELGKANDDAAKAAKDHAKQIADVIANLQWELSIVNLAEDEQAALNAVRSAGVDIMSKQGQEIYKLTKALQDERDMIAFNREELARLAQDYAANDYEGVEANFQWDENIKQQVKKWNDYLKTEVDELEQKYQELDTLFKQGEITPEVYYNALGKLTDEHNDAAKKIVSTWEHTKEKIQDITADFFAGSMKGDADSFSALAQSFGNAMIDITSQSMAESFKDFKFDGLSDVLGETLGGVFKSLTDDVGFEIQNLVAVAATLYNTTKMTKVQGGISGGVAGAQAGGSSGNWYAAVAGGILGGAAGYMLGDNGPSYGEQLSTAIKELIETLQANNVLLADQILNTNELTLAQEKMTRSIFSTKMEGVNATLAGAFKIPEGMEKRSHSSSIYKGVLADFAGTFMDELAGLGTAWSLNPTLRDEGYTATKYSKAETSDIISQALDKMGAAEFILWMKKSANDAGEFINGLKEMGFIAAEIPERVLKHFSSGSSDAKRNEKVAGAIFEVMLNGIMELSVGIGKMNDASVAFAKTWADKDISAFNKDMQDWQDTMNVFAGKDMVKYLAEIQAAKDALEATSQEDLDKMDVSQMADHIKNIAALGKVIDDTATKIEDAEKTRLVIEQYYSDQRDDIMADMTKEMDIASGKYSQLEQSYMSIMDKAEAYRLELIDNGMAYEEAGEAARDYAVDIKTATKNAQMAATALAYNNNITQKNIDLLTLLGKTDEAEAAIKKQTLDTRIAEVQSLKDIYGANTELFQTNLDLAKASWAADDALSSATTRLAKMAEAMEGMWGEDSILEAKQAWITVLESLGETVTPKFFLDSIGLGTDSGLEHLLSATTSDEVHADLIELITLYRTGVIKQDDFNAILGKINDNASDIAQNTEDMAAAMEEASKINTQAGEWLRETLATYQDSSSGFDAELKSVTDVMEDFRDQLEATGKTVSEVWAAGGKIENELASLIRDKWLADLKEETAVSKSGYAELADKRDELLKNYADNSIDIPALQSYAVGIQNEQARLMAEAQQMIADHPEQTANDPGWPQFVIDSFQQSIDYWGDELKTVNDKIAYATETTAEINAWYARESLALDRENLDSVRDSIYSITGDTDILWQQLIDLQKDWMAVDATDISAQMDILNEQNNILETIRDIQKEQLQETIDNYNAIQDVILELQGGSLAPVQSLEFFDRRYAQLFEGAQSGKTEDISAFTNFISTYADFMGSIDGLDYKTLTAGIISDLTGLQTTVTGGATLDDLNAQLEALNSTDSPIVAELVRIGDLLAGKTGSGTLSDALAFDEQAYLQRYADVAAAVASNDFMSGYDHYQSFGKDEGRIPGFASGTNNFGGGLRLVGERGPELEYTGPSRIQSNESMTKMITNAVVAALGGRTSGEVIVTVNLDGKAIDPRLVKVIKTNTEAQYHIKRAANGR